MEVGGGGGAVDLLGPHAGTNNTTVTQDFGPIEGSWDLRRRRMPNMCVDKLCYFGWGDLK